MHKLDLLKELVKTEYEDLTGIFKIDTHLDMPSLYKLCKDFEFDTQSIFIVGVGFSYIFDEKNIENRTLPCSIFYVNREQYGKDYEVVEANISKDNTTTIYKKVINIPFQLLSKYFKEFECVAVTPVLRQATNFQFLPV